MKIVNKYKLKDYVNIIDLETKGRVIAFYEDFHGIQYQVRYFLSGDIKNVYFFEDEIEPYRDKKIGMKT